MGGKLQYGPPDAQRMQLELGPIFENEPNQEPITLPPAITPPETTKEALYDLANDRISKLSRQINPSYDKFPSFKPSFTPLEAVEKYTDMPYGYVPGVDNDDLYSDTQGFFGALGRTALRFPAFVTTKLGQNVGFLYGLANPANWGEDIIAKAADNGISNFFSGLEEDVKNKYLRTFNSAEDREKGFFSRMFTDKEFWSEDFVDGAAFMASAWIPGWGLNKLNLGSKVLGSVGKAFGKNISSPAPINTIEAMATGANYYTRAQQALNNLSKFNAIAMATASESLFEANEVKDNIYKSLSKDELGIPKINPNTGQFYTEDEKIEVAAKGARNAFLMNASLLSITNAFEFPYVSRLMGFKPATGLRRMTGGNRIGEELAMAAPKNKWGRFLNSSYGQFAKGMGLGILREGYVEENIQLAIQRVNEELGKNGIVADMLDFNTYAALGEQSFTQATDAAMGNDPIASMNIGLGGLLGGGMTAFSEKAQFKREKLNTEQVIDYYNKAQDNFLKFGNIFKTTAVNITDDAGNVTTENKIAFDADGQPIIDNDKLGAVLSNAKGYVTMLGMSDDVADESPLLKNILRDKAFSSFVQAHIKAGNEKGLVQKLESLKNSTPEDLAMLGFVKNDDFNEQIERYKGLAARIIKQNKAIESNVRFDQTPQDTARKYKLMDLASDQAIFRQLINDELSYLDELKNEIVNSSNSSLSDGLVEQLNTIKLRIKSQQQLIDNLKQQGTKPAFVALHEQTLKDLQAMEAKLKNDNQTSLAELKENPDGLYLYEKESRNDASVYNPMIQRLRTNGEIENEILNLGRQYAVMTDNLTGKDTFLKLFTENEVQDVNNKIEESNKTAVPAATDEDIDVDADLLGDIPVQNITLGEETQPPVQLSKPPLDTYLRERFDDLQSQGKLPQELDYDDWYGSGQANGWIKYYNEYYKASENLVTKQPAETEEQIEGVEEETEDELVAGELGTQIKSSLKIGNYIVNLGDKVNDEEITLITDKVVKLGDEIVEHANLLKRIDAFKGQNITRAGEKEEQTGIENGDIKDVQDTKAATLSQKLQEAINKASEGVVFGGSAKVVKGGSKINNQSDFYEMAVKPVGDKAINIDRKRTIPNEKYPLVMGTSQINVGTNIRLIPDPDLKEFDQPDSMNPERITRRKSAEFFKDGKIKEEAIGDFPVRIETDVDGKSVVLGYLPTIDWLEARWNNSATEDTMNVVEFIRTPDGQVINNLEIQREALINLRSSLKEGFNDNSRFIVNAKVDNKSDGFLRVDPNKQFQKLSKVLHPSTKIGVIRNGSVYLSDDEVLSRDNIIANFDDFSGKEGWPVVLIPTPTGKTLVSFVSVPTLAPEHQDFILRAWTAFHNVKSAAPGMDMREDLSIVKAVYNAFDTSFDESTEPDFIILRNYVNDYITYTSGKQYNPLLKEGSGQLNITEKGEITLWVVKGKTKEKDLVIAANPKEMLYKDAEFNTKEGNFRDKLRSLYYNVKTSTPYSNGINSAAPMQFLSSVGGKVKISSTPKTYNEYMMNILETNIEKGRPVDPNDKTSPFVHFANPVLTFSQVANSVLPEEEQDSDPITKLFGPVVNPFNAKPTPPADIQAREEARENWIASTESIRKSPTTAGVEATVFDKTGAFSVITAPTENELKAKIDDYYRKLVGIKPKAPAPTAPVSKIKTVDDIKRYFFNKQPGLFGGDLNTALTMTNWTMVSNSLAKGATQEELNMLEVLNGRADISTIIGVKPVSDIEAKKADNTISNGDKIISVKTKPVTNEITDTAEDLFILPDKNPEGRIHINMAPLKDILVVPNNTLTVIDKKTGKEIVNKELNPEGAVIFEAMQGRLFVVANINGQLVPFYKSSAGTSGKTQGAWYPFFGYTGAWLVKGSIDKSTGKMSYSPEIDKVTDLLNENLVFPDKYINRATNSIKNTKGEVIIDMNQAFKVNRLWQKEFGSQTGIGTNYQIKGLKENTRSESGLVALITGLNTTELDSSKTPKENSEWFNLISKNAELAALEGKPTAPETGELLDLDFDIGDTAEDIGSLPTEKKSIATSLKTLKKTCD